MAARRRPRYGLRKPKTSQEKRETQPENIDGIVIRPRAKRNAENLPHAWDDIPAMRWIRPHKEFGAKQADFRPRNNVANYEIPDDEDE